jgi:hypothetical protein
VRSPEASGSHYARALAQTSKRALAQTSKKAIMSERDEELIDLVKTNF